MYRNLNVKSLETIIKNREELSNKIQSQFDFKVPNYILDEIIDRQETKSYNNLYALLGLAIFNNRITKEQANKIKSIYN